MKKLVFLLVLFAAFNLSAQKIQISQVNGLTMALKAKAPLNDPAFTGTVTGIQKMYVGLGNVDNTSDINKPVSTATQSALDLKAPKASPVFTGTVTGDYWQLGTALNLYSYFGLSWSSTTDHTGTKDVGLRRYGVGLLQISDGTNSGTHGDLILKNITLSGTATGFTKSMVGLGNVDNTSDATKQAGYDTRYNLVSENVNPYDYVYRKGQVDTLLTAKANLSGAEFTGVVMTNDAIISNGTNPTTSYISTHSTYKAQSTTMNLLIGNTTPAIDITNVTLSSDSKPAIRLQTGNATQKSLLIRTAAEGGILERTAFSTAQFQIHNTYLDEGTLVPNGIFDVTASTGHLFTVYDTGVTSIKYSVSALNTAPSSATDTGTLGEIRITADYIFVCTATNTWKRTALTTW